MLSLRRAFGRLLALALLPLTLAAQGQQTKKVEITTIAPLVFGTIVANGTGTITIGPDGTRSIGGLFSPDSSFNAARFEVRIQGGRQVSLILPQEAILVNGSGAQMRVDTFRSLPDGTVTVARPGASTELSVGAALHVSAGQMPGTYQGSYLIVFSTVN